MIKGNQIDNGLMTPFRNKIINGCMRLAQRGTSFTVGQAAGAYTLDRWLSINDHDAGNLTVSQVLRYDHLQNSMSLTNAAGNDTSIGAGQYCFFEHRVEGYNIVPLRVGKMTLSFSVYSNKTGIYSVVFRNGVNNRTYVAEYTINAVNTWENKSILCDLSAGIVSGTWNYTNGQGLFITFPLAVGSTYKTSILNTWQSTNYLASTNQVNWLNEQNNTFYITGVQLEAGPVATDFEQRSFADELRYCQRYFCKTYNQSEAPGTASASSNGAWGLNRTNGDVSLCWSFPVTMRASPGYCRVFSPVTGTIDRVNSAGSDCAASCGGVNETSACMYSSSVPALYDSRGHIVAEAEL